MPRRADSGWGRNEANEAQELAGMWASGFKRAVKARLEGMDSALRCATVATMAHALAGQTAHADSLLRYVRTQVPRRDGA